MGKKNGGVQVRMYDPDTEVYGEVPKYALAIEYEHDDEDRFKGGFTIGSFVGDKPHGLTWQWKGGELYHGLLYGLVDSAGMFTGDNITFIYPDLQTGLQGRFLKGELVEAKTVEIVSERSHNGLKELRFEKARPFNVIWNRDMADDSYIGAHQLIMDPHERKSVYIADSIGGKDDGVFALKRFEPDDLVSYFNGIKTTDEKIFHKKMTDEEEEHAGAIYFGLGAEAPDIYNIPENLELDIPDQYRSVDNYRTTLGHKVNHKFEDTNVEYKIVDHPVFGVIVCLIATEDIDVDDELFASYNYGLDEAPQWYKDLHDEEYS